MYMVQPLHKLPALTSDDLVSNYIISLYNLAPKMFAG